MKKQNSDFDAMEVAWEMFEKTGKIEYYTLYKNLKNK